LAFTYGIDVASEGECDPQMQQGMSAQLVSMLGMHRIRGIMGACGFTGVCCSGIV